MSDPRIWFLGFRSPELRPGTNTSIGRLRIDATGGEIIEKTDRSGIVENDAFTRLIEPALAHVTEISRATLDVDFARNPRIHRCWELRHRA